MYFTASLLFKSVHTPSDHEAPVWEEQIILFEAEDASAAERKAAVYGKAHEVEYRNQADELVHWTFERIERVCEIQDDLLKDGTELFSRFLKDAEVKSLLTPFDD
jgi:hypothetical protein